MSLWGRLRNDFRVWLLCYTAVLFACLSIRPLWLDEILQLLGTTKASLSEQLAWVVENPGSAPLGWLTQYEMMRWLGSSVFAARLPSALAGIAAAYGVWLLAKRIEIRNPILPLCLFMIVPLYFRYALEARAYEQALCLSVFATLSVLRLTEDPGWKAAVVYALLLSAGLYTLPYSVFPAFGYSAYLFLRRTNPQAKKAFLFATGSLILATLSFTPWYLASRRHWHDSIESSGFSFTLTPKLPLVMIREISGGGYFCSVLLLIAAGIGLWRFRHVSFAARAQVTTGVLLFGAITTVFLALLADAVFGYFYAIRQILWILPPLILLASLGIDWLQERHRLAAQVMIALLIAGSVWKNYRWLSDAKEDWRQAAIALRQESREGGCIYYVSGGYSREMFEYMESGLISRECGGEVRSSRVIVAVHPYVTAVEKKNATLHLQSLGFHPLKDYVVGGTRIQVVSRDISSQTLPPSH